MRDDFRSEQAPNLRVGDKVEVHGFPMVVGYVGGGLRPIVLAAEDGRAVSWGVRCTSEDAGDREEVLCVDVVSGARYRMCFSCRGVLSGDALA